MSSPTKTCQYSWVTTSGIDFLQLIEEGGAVVSGINSTGTGFGNLAGGGGTIGGSIASGQIAVGSGTNTVSGSGALTFSAGALVASPTASINFSNSGSGGTTIADSGAGGITIQQTNSSLSEITIEAGGSTATSLILLEANVPTSTPTTNGIFGLELEGLGGSGGTFGVQMADGLTGFLATGGTTASPNGQCEIIVQSSVGNTLEMVFSATAHSLKISNDQAATSGANQSSPSLVFVGSVWNGGSISDTWTINPALGTGTNPTSTLTISHTGSTTGAVAILMSNNVQIGSHFNGNNTDFAGVIAVSSSTTATVTFANNYTGTNAPLVVLTPLSDPTTTGVYWVTYTGSTGAWTGFTVNVKVSGTISFNYQVIGNVS
jgi:hypothetical protein